MNERPCRRWFRFRLLTLFVLMAVAAVPLAWVGYSLNWIRERRIAQAKSGDGLTQVSLPADFDFSVFQCRAPCGLWLFKETGYRELRSRTPEETDRLERLFPEAVILNVDGDESPQYLPN